jgi:hypothetical protein
MSQEKPFDAGEELYYNLRYKYGLIMLKAGTAKFSVRNVYYNRSLALETSMTVRTSPFFDKIYKMRDTLQSYINTRFEPIYHIRRLHESNFNYNEEIFYNAYGKDYSEVRVIRSNESGVRFDEVLNCNNQGLDMLSILIFARTLNYPDMHKGQTVRITNFFGKSKINIFARYIGEEEIENADAIKYQAYKLNIDVSDKAFKESKNAMEIWISADANRLPLKLKAQLKIGAAEAQLASYKNLKHSLGSKKILKK